MSMQHCKLHAVSVETGRTSSSLLMDVKMHRHHGLQIILLKHSYFSQKSKRAEIQKGRDSKRQKFTKAEIQKDRNSKKPEIQKARNLKTLKFKIQNFKKPETQKFRSSKGRNSKIQKSRNSKSQKFNKADFQKTRYYGGIFNSLGLIYLLQ